MYVEENPRGMNAAAEILLAYQHCVDQSSQSIILQKLYTEITILIPIWITETWGPFLDTPGNIPGTPFLESPGDIQY